MVGEIWGSGTDPRSPGCSSGLDSEVLYTSAPGALGDAELKQALLAGKSRATSPPHPPVPGLEAMLPLSGAVPGLGYGSDLIRALITAL